MDRVTIIAIFFTKHDHILLTDKEYRKNWNWIKSWDIVCIRWGLENTISPV